MSSFLKRLMNSQARVLANSERGFTLVEVMVVIVIISVLALGSVSLISLVFDSNMRSGQIFDQQTTAEQTDAYLSRHLSLAQIPVGMEGAVAGRIDPLTVAGDQLVFESGDDRQCMRVFYERALSRIRVKTAATCTDTGIRPKRGPNQALVDTVASAPNNGNGTWEPGETYYDPALDLAPGAGCGAAPNCNPAWRGAFVLANGIIKDRPANAAASEYPLLLNLFVYRNDNQEKLGTGGAVGTRAGPDPVATHNSSNAWYSVLANRDNVSSADASYYISSVNTGRSALVAPRAYQKNLSFQQLLFLSTTIP